MKKINLRDLFPEYKLNCYIEVPDANAKAYVASLTQEVAHELFESERAETAYKRNQYRNKAYYSLDRNDGIEGSALFMYGDPYEEYERKMTQEQLYAAINSLSDKQAKRIYAHYFLGMSKNAIAKVEGVDKNSVRESINRALIGIEKYLTNFS